MEDVVRRAYAPYVPRIGREPGPMGEDHAAPIPSGRVWVAGRGGAGCWCCCPSARRCCSTPWRCIPTRRGRGALLRHAERVAREAGCARIRLHTDEAMTENVGLCARIGYAETHRGEERGFRRVYRGKALGG